MVKVRAVSVRFLTLTAFVCGMVIMAVEMAASRLMAPYFGTSVFVWTNLLGIIMLALSLGYYFGGRIADRNPTEQYLYTLLFGASLILFVLPFAAPFIMNFVSSGVSEGEFSIVVSSFVSSLIVFCIPFLALGMVSPTIIRLLSSEVDHSGRIAGRVYAASTVGSILGTFLPTLVFVPWIGTKKTILLFALVLCIVSLIGLGKRLLWGVIGVFVAALVLIPPQYFTSADIVYQTESPYSYLKVTKDSFYGNMLQQDEGYAMHSVYNPDRIFTGAYWDYLYFAPYFQPDKKEQKAAVIGAAGGTAYRMWEETSGDQFDFTFEGAEIDPVVVDLSRKYFGMDQYPNVEVSAQDGRIFLKQSKGDYDIVFLDAYRQIYMPPHLTSLEFFQLVRDRMSEDGVMIANVNAMFEGSDIYQRMVRTLQEVFPKVWVLQVGDGSFNYLFFATSGQGDLGTALTSIPERYSFLRAEALPKIARLDTIRSDIALITDDRPLSEVLFDRMIGEWLLGRRN
ncbi:hypothetical protein AUK40_02200 [Candidatus Wirthbacteria bacterium CG2_30_54_11]|uniref:PABS domain-containing protein n=1 Tax=Candidatus Wirthbacteria bacterium CG2_30_54_11 TaxID=1817892 RepID=A0A1J5ILC0_9BACT|nr:MAG: hypothetical protein AUK40_02200 [Candidatus Wirthbacteria bacterium CG2_30_54_11]